MTTGLGPCDGTCQAISFSPSALVRVTSSACDRPAAAGAVRLGPGKYITARWKMYISPSNPPQPSTAIKIHFKMAIRSHNLLSGSSGRKPTLIFTAYLNVHSLNGSSNVLKGLIDKNRGFVHAQGIGINDDSG